MKSIYVLISGIEKSLEHEWYVQYSKHQNFKITYILINPPNGHFEDYLNKQQIDTKTYYHKNKIELLVCIFKIWTLFLFSRPNIVHTHLFDASLIGMIASFFSGVKKRVLTRHHSDYHHVYHPSAVKYDKLINKLSTNIIAVSDTVKSILVEKEQVESDKIITIEHAVDLSMFDENSIDENRIRNLKEKYQIENNARVIGVISRFTEWKGIQYIIPAFKHYFEKFPDSILVLANATGDYKNEIVKLLEELPKHSYRTISFEKDSAALFQVFNMFIHVPISPSVEAFGQVYIEALASKIPCVFTKSGIGTKILVNKKNCLIVDYLNSDEIVDAMLRITNDLNLRSTIIENGYNTVKSMFSIEWKNQQIFDVYR